MQTPRVAFPFTAILNLIAYCSLSVAPPLAAQRIDSLPQSEIAIDHRTHAVTLRKFNTQTPPRVATVTTPYEEWDLIRVPAGHVGVWLENTSSALYTCAVNTKIATDPARDSVQAFLGAVTPYFGGILTAVLGAIGQNIESENPADSASFAVSAVERSLTDLDSALIGPNGVRRYRLRAIAALDTLYLHHTAQTFSKPPDNAADIRIWVANADSETVARFQTWMGKHRFAETSPDSLEPFTSLTGHLITILASLDSNTSALRDRIGKESQPKREPQRQPAHPISDQEARKKAKGDSLKQTEATVLKAADAALAMADAIIAASYETQSLVSAVFHNRSRVHCGDPAIPRNHPRELDVAVATQNIPELSRLAEVGSVTMTVTALPGQAQIRPVVGLSAIYAVNARYPTYVAAHPDTTGSKGLSVQRNGVQDHRGLYGATLGARFPALDERLHVSLIVPQLMVSPGPDTKAFGVGAAIGVSVFNFGVGAIWVQHTIYADSVGAILPDASLLHTTTGYGRARTFFSVSLNFWPTGGGSSK